jgi:ABC-type transport system involved in multi-copper enzyme maturation permease subunit
MNQTIAIALNTFREAIRNRVFFSLALFAIGMLVLTLAVSSASLHEEVRLMKDVGLFLTSSFSVLIAVFVGVNLVYKEIERKTIHTVMPKPIHRYQFLLGKYFGLSGTLAIQVAIMGAVLAALFQSINGSVGPVMLLIGLMLAWWVIDFGLQASGARQLDPAQRGDMPVHIDRLRSLLAVTAGVGILGFTGATLSLEMLQALFLVYIEVLVVIAVALVFSSFSTPFLSGALTFGVFIIGRFADTLATLKLGTAKDPDPLLERIETLVHGVAYIVPDLSRYNTTPYVVYESAIEWGYVGHATLYGLTYATICLVLASALFSRRDFV